MGIIIMNCFHTNLNILTLNCTGICGQRYITLHDEEPDYNLQTINYPKQYRNDISCVWLVTSSHQYVILVTILDFELERGYDHVIVGNGHVPSDQFSRIAALTGVVKLRTLVSSHWKTWIELKTDRTGTRRGFDMLLSEIDFEGINGR